MTGPSAVSLHELQVDVNVETYSIVVLEWIRTTMIKKRSRKILIWPMLWSTINFLVTLSLIYTMLKLVHLNVLFYEILIISSFKDWPSKPIFEIPAIPFIIPSSRQLVSININNFTVAFAVPYFYPSLHPCRRLVTNWPNYWNTV